MHTVTASTAIEMAPERVAASIPGADSYYVTIDIDVIDPSLAPGTEPRRRGLHVIPTPRSAEG